MFVTDPTDSLIRLILFSTTSTILRHETSGLITSLCSPGKIRESMRGEEKQEP